MNRNKVNSIWETTWTVFLCSALIAVNAQAQTVTTLVTFDGINGYGPSASLVQGTDGNFYGTTGGASDGTGATVFKITPSGVLTTLYTFATLTPAISWSVYGLVQGSDGNFYGTTGSGPPDILPRPGSVFKITPSGAFTMLTDFDQSPYPLAANDGLIQATDGNFYGTTSLGGVGGDGVIFEITPEGTLTTLFSFGGIDILPFSGLVQANDGNFYGTTGNGGKQLGTLFEFTLPNTLATLYEFGSAPGDGAFPRAGLIQGSDGNFYGTTDDGPGGRSTVFKFSPTAGLTTLHIFGGPPTDGAGHPSSLLQAADGNFYGVTSRGGAGDCPQNNNSGCGTIFKITSSGEETMLYSFGSTSTDGANPEAALIQSADGNFYGTTLGGGTGGDGTVFQFSLASPDVPAIASSGGVLNGASFQPGISPGSWITISGTNLATKPDSWTVVNGVLPTSVDSVSVSVGGQPAYVEYISATQINAVAPNVPSGTVSVTVTNANGTSQAAMAQLSAETPAFFQWGTYAVATYQDFAYAVKNGAIAGLTTVPAKPGDVIILWGTGFGPTSPAVPAGMETPSTTTYNTANKVSVTVGGKPANVYGAALASGYAGLYQVAIQIPAGLANGDYPVVATVNGASSPSTTLITVQQ
jgi:uncharacterized protein (TIGR03437 family)